MIQQEAIKTLAEWRSQSCPDLEKDGLCVKCWAVERYQSMLSANVAALIRNADARSTTESQLISTATRLTHATIQSLTDGAKEGG